MSVGDDVTYIYEPFFDAKINGIKIEKQKDTEIVRKYLTDLFQCEISYKKRKKTHKGMCKKKHETLMENHYIDL